MLSRPRARVALPGPIRDVLVIAPTTLLCLIQVIQQDGQGVRTGGLWGGLVLVAALMAPLPWRRRYPLTVFALTASVSFVQWAAGLDMIAANIAVLVAMYGVASRRRLRWAIAAGAVAEFGILLVVLRPDGAVPVLIREYAAFSVFVVAIWIAGIGANTRRRYVESLVERAEQAERERDQQAIITAAAERVRIARELHDVVAHDMSVIVIHADGAGYALDSDPELAREALRTISATGRRGLAEMRRLVGVLRDDTGTAEPHAPQPGLARLDELVERSRTSGLPTGLAVRGTPRELPEGEQLVIYRIVQEALTNSLKHGGPGTRATVEVAFGREEVELEIADDGRGAAVPGIAGGHGLVGMRERAAVYGGTVSAAPRPGGGFRVLARIPVRRDEPEPTR
ncbi:sensor histidine kinase [Streptosporangium sp. NPDC023615]|uniref:sensor histidine kinase n=1 Tax=Streptosporangium sp. NPDC023615 TaxID=3154794 RepID=UPI0034492ABC